MASNYKEKLASAGAKSSKPIVRKDANVVVIAGADKGKRGRVLEVIKNKDRVLVEGVNVRRCVERSDDGSTRQFQDRECPIHVSNVMLEERYDARRG